MRVRTLFGALAVLLASCGSVREEAAQVPPAKEVKEYLLLHVFPDIRSAKLASSYEAGVDPYISDQTYPMRSEAQSQVRLVALDFSDQFACDPTPEQIIERARQLGYEQPCYEDALRLGAHFPREGLEVPLAFLHEPDERQGVLCIRSWQGSRGLSRTLCGPTTHWSRGRYLFVFRRAS